ncbi:hypothetical protein E6W39_02605 [Kitasatospora acidiphila]|uniref:N-acetyltransferase domain-containing protein n=1 Tax=Kitasatospora acidiphila TaxID=2567942 RepID=A0A540VX58_9ACTN|nr:GNAT family N-acetyltransferase [Kitasatospora acidiphila]TQF01331.1 hypothetical protein E6W39_02605 [Kitasatospora acidiphila]
MIDKMYLDTDRTWRGRTISVRPSRWYASVVLDRDGYVDTLNARNEESQLPEAFLEAVQRFNDSGCDRIWYDGYTGGFLSGHGARGVTLYTPFTHVQPAREALRAAEIDHDYTALHDLAEQLALPIDNWLAPGERQLLRGTDFLPLPALFLRFLRAQAGRRGLRLNGRAEAGSVWVRPTLDPYEKTIRERHPERHPGWVDRWSDHVDPDDTPWRPWVGGRDQDLSRGALPVTFLSVTLPETDKCPCGFSRANVEHDDVHRERHSEWAFGIRVPKNAVWGDDLVVVTSQSPIAWRRLAERMGQLPRRESNYDFNSWSHVGEPEETPERFRAYLLRVDDHVVGYLAAHDTDRHRWWDLGERSKYGERNDAVRPRIDMIWTAETYRRHGVGKILVQALAKDSGCEVEDVSWSSPVSDDGRLLALRLSPGGVWVS